MGKLIAWMMLIFVVLLALRMISLRNARRSGRDSNAGAAGNAAQPMVRCVRCGVYLPRADARAVREGFACADEKCVEAK